MNRDLAGRVAVVGVGTTRYGKLPEYDAYDLGVWALQARARRLRPQASTDIDGLIVNRIPDYQRFGEIAGMDPRLRDDHAGAGPLLRHLHRDRGRADPAGLADTVALVYGNNGRSAGDRMAAPATRTAAAASARGFPTA